MSFDLGVWHADKAPTDDEALALYVRLCEAEPQFSEENAAVSAFYQELCARYPEIDDWPEDDIANCPWSCGHDRSGGHVFMAMRHGCSDAVCEYIVELAAKHSLICFDPQGPDVYLPPNMEPPPEPEAPKLFWQFWK